MCVWEGLSWGPLRLGSSHRCVCVGGPELGAIVGGVEPQVWGGEGLSWGH